MPSYSGKFQYTPSDGGAPQQGACAIRFDEQQFTLSPDSGQPTAFDLGDMDAVQLADYQISIPLFNGSKLTLQQFGKAYGDLARELLEAYRKRTLQCLLLQDLQEIARYQGSFTLEVTGQTANSGAADIRLYKSNLAILPNVSPAFHWRLADVDLFHFDPSNYEVVLESDAGRLRIAKLGKRTEEFATSLRRAMDALNAESAEALHSLFPFLDADQVRSATGLLREGRSVLAAKLNAIDPRMASPIAENAVDSALKPYFDELVSRSGGVLYTGFKLIRPEDGVGEAAAEIAGQDGDDVVGAPDADTDRPQALYWFFFPLPARHSSGSPEQFVAWECSSASGRATYLFRLSSDSPAGDNASGLDAAIARLSRVLGMLNFRRRPIYLSNEQLESNPMFHRYAIAARRLPEVREVRAEFVGRAMHSSIDTWKTQMDNLLDTR